MEESSSQWVGEAARCLLRAHRSRVPAAPLSRTRPGFALADAYRVQDAVIAERLAAGDRVGVAGHKVGVTSVAMQVQMGVDEPDSGVLLTDMVLPSGTRLAMSEFLRPRIEGEIAFRLGRELTGGADAAQCRDAVSEVFLALEVIDTRFGDWRIGVADSIADNASCARVICGDPVAWEPGWDLCSERLTLAVDGVPVATGEGRAVLGNPVNPLVWLARRISAVGARPLRAGQIVLAGAVHASIPLTRGVRVQLSSPRLPPVNLQIQ